MPIFLPRPKKHRNCVKYGVFVFPLWGMFFVENGSAGLLFIKHMHCNLQNRNI